MAQHITNGNCSPPCSGGLGSAKPQSALRAFVRFRSTTFYQPWSCFASPLFGLAKRQLPRTLAKSASRLLLNWRRASPQSGSPLRGLRLTAGSRHTATLVQAPPPRHVVNPPPLMHSTKPFHAIDYFLLLVLILTQLTMMK